MANGYNLNFRQDSLIAEKYEEMRASVFTYVLRRTGSESDAEDMTQDVFLKLLEYDGLLSAHSLPQFIFRIARNLVTDWYRHHAHTEKAREFFAGARTWADTTAENVDFRRLQTIEKECLGRMGEQKGRIYLLYIHAGRSANEIAESLSLSRRTVENHIFAARNLIREELRKAQ